MLLNLYVTSTGILYHTRVYGCLSGKYLVLSVNIHLTGESTAHLTLLQVVITFFLQLQVAFTLASAMTLCFVVDLHRVDIGIQDPLLLDILLNSLTTINSE
jgi:hypothetical protein